MWVSRVWVGNRWSHSGGVWQSSEGQEWPVHATVHATVHMGLQPCGYCHYFILTHILCIHQCEPTCLCLHPAAHVCARFLGTCICAWACGDPHTCTRIHVRYVLCMLRRVWTKGSQKLSLPNWGLGIA